MENVNNADGVENNKETVKRLRKSLVMAIADKYSGERAI